MTLVIAAAMLVMGSCQRKPVMAHARFVHLPTDGWQRTLPLTFRPEYDDSAATYDITLAVRYDNSYRYRNLTVAVDVITADSAVNRRTVDMALADEYGNWTGGGLLSCGSRWVSATPSGDWSTWASSLLLLQKNRRQTCVIISNSLKYTNLIWSFR